MSALDDPATRAHAITRYKRVLAASALAGLGASLAIAVWLDRVWGPLGLVGLLATIGGIGGSIVMAGALMGLVFMSSGTGHDESVGRR